MVKNLPVMQEIEGDLGLIPEVVRVSIMRCLPAKKQKTVCVGGRGGG